MSFYITKYSGEKELFDVHKFRRSLKRSGASPRMISQLIREIEEMPELKSTHDIYEFALSRLHKENPPVAARYNLKRALFDLGPSGFPFEKFIAEVFKEQGFTTSVDQVIPGKCVMHEVDVIATMKNKHAMIECKFHNQQGIKADVKVTLYVKSRFDDIMDAWTQDKSRGHKLDEAWVATNTKFTAQAIQYADCVNLRLLGWSYPEHNNLAELIDTLGLHPITALVSLNSHQKQQLINEGFVLCRDLHKSEQLLRHLGFSEHHIKQLMKESHEVCTLQPQE